MYRHCDISIRHKTIQNRQSKPYNNLTDIWKLADFTEERATFIQKGGYKMRKALLGVLAAGLIAMTGR